jgi:hypothetical protein
MTLCGKSEIAVNAWAAVDVACHAAALDRVGVAAIGRQLVHTTHDQLPFFAMGLNTFAEQLMRNQVRHLVGNRLLKKIVAVFSVQLRIEPQHIFMQVRDACLLSAQLEADHRAFEGAFEKVFGLLITDFNAGCDVFGHS